MHEVRQRPERRSLVQVAFAKVAPRYDLLAHEDEAAAAVEASLVPGAEYVRYGRSWRMGQWHSENGYLYGRIGFQRVGGVTELWNDDIVDFQEVARVEGTTSPFAIDSNDLRMAFQLRSGVIRPTTFTGAFQALLNEASDLWRWRVEHYVREISWPRWLESVSRVKALNVRLERPNPDYRDRDALEAIIEGARLNILRLGLVADPDDPNGIDVNDAFVREAIEHAEEYGEWNAVAEVVEGGEAQDVRWRSEQEGISPQSTVEADPETGEVHGETLRKELDEFQPPPDET